MLINVKLYIPKNQDSHKLNFVTITLVDTVFMNTLNIFHKSLGDFRYHKMRIKFSKIYKLKVMQNYVMSLLIQILIIFCLHIRKHPLTCFTTKELNKTERTQD